MKNPLLLGCVVCALAFSIYHAAAEPKDTQKSGFNLKVQLRDGSCVKGIMSENRLSLHSPLLGDINLAWSKIYSAKYDDDGMVLLTMTNGDTLTVSILRNQLNLEASFGRINLPMTQIRHIEVQPLIKTGLLPTGLVAMWPGGDASGQGSSNNTLLVNQATLGAGKIGKGFVLDGNGAGVKIANDDTNLYLQNFTFLAWIKRASPSVVSYGSGGNGVILSCSPGGYCFFVNSSSHLVLSQLGNYAMATGPAISDTDWHQVAVTKNGNLVEFYLDGASKAATPYQVLFTFNGYIGIGYRPDNGDNSFYGVIDELSVYNRALSASEIQSVYSDQPCDRSSDIPLSATK